MLFFEQPTQQAHDLNIPTTKLHTSQHYTHTAAGRVKEEDGWKSVSGCENKHFHALVSE